MLHDSRVGLKVREAQESMPSMDRLAAALCQKQPGLCGLETSLGLGPGLSRNTWVPAVGHLLMSSVTLGKSLARSEAQFPLQ